MHVSRETRPGAIEARLQAHARQALQRQIAKQATAEAAVAAARQRLSEMTLRAPLDGEDPVVIKRVEYYFGKSWGQNIFASEDRAHGFAISTSAYGPFMCTAEIHFSDGDVTTVARYIDFEMGAVGAQPEPPARTSKGRRKGRPA